MYFLNLLGKRSEQTDDAEKCKACESSARAYPRTHSMRESKVRGVISFRVL